MTHVTIGQLAERAGVATSAIRFYESRGPITSVRTTGNQRRYERSTLRRVAFIRTALRDRRDGCIGCGCLEPQGRRAAR